MMGINNMRIPSKIKIGAHEVMVKKRKMDELYGEFDKDSLTITIDNTKPITIQEETFIHEIIHAINWLAGIEIKDEEKEEKNVQALGHLLYQVLKDNNLLK